MAEQRKSTIAIFLKHQGCTSRQCRKIFACMCRQDFSEKTSRQPEAGIYLDNLLMNRADVQPIENKFDISVCLEGPLEETR